jgi:hypothetical protein
MNILSHVADIENELCVSLTGGEIEVQGFEETPHMHGDDIHYDIRTFTRTTFHATGFRMSRDGVIISGNFANPVAVVTVETNDTGEVFDTEFDEANVARAVLAKLGGIPDVEGGLRAAAGV